MSASPRSRLSNGLLVLMCGLLLFLAWSLEPSAEGHGTHLQLGLGQCWILSSTGHPCPTCGMTTSYALAMEGRWIDSLQNQPMGFLIWLLNAAALIVAALELMMPKDRWSPVFQFVEKNDRLIAVTGFALLAGAWGYKAGMMMSAGPAP